MATSEGESREAGLSPAGRSNGRVRITGDRDLRLPLPDHSGIVHCTQAHHGPVSGGGEESRVKDGQSVVGSVRFVLEGDMDGGSGGGTGG